jgi:hypothetical protein
MGTSSVAARSFFFITFQKLIQFVLMIYFTLTALFCLLAVFFAAVRIPELSTVLCTDLTGAFVILLAFGGCASTILYPAKTWWLKLRRFALVALVR